MGDTFTATVKADYYFGAPVASGTVKYRIKRAQKSAHWYPTGRWDWLYGKGYAWTNGDYSWYPGWENWGCFPRRPFWMHWNEPHPELVVEGETELSDDGTAKITLDTSAAAAFGEKSDHVYTIEVDVTDESRRVISGSGTVTAAQQPFKIYAWNDRGYYTPEATATTQFRVQTADGKPVQGTGLVTLYRIRYQADAIREEKLETWKLDPTDGDGKQVFTTADSGQYRITWEVTDADGLTETGGTVFAVRGNETNANDFRFTDLELSLDRTEYGVGETANLLVSSNQDRANVFLFIRPVGGVSPKPEHLVLANKSSLFPIDIEESDQPNFFVEALTIHGGQVHSAVKEVIVPPKKRALTIAVQPSTDRAKPGAEAEVEILLTDSTGQPFQGTAAVTVYDKSVEYISGGSNVPDILQHFWSWKRHFHHSRWNTQTRVSSQNYADQNMRILYHSLGRAVPGDMFKSDRLDRKGKMVRSVSKQSAGFSLGYAMAPASSAAPADPFAAAPAEKMEMANMVLAEESGLGAGGDAFGAPATPVTVRKEFADTAYWAGTVTTDANGKATLPITMPENLTTWVIRTWGLGAGTVVGQGDAEIITSKDLLIRQQAPRFFVERDQVTLSANVHNYLDTQQAVTVTLEFDGDHLSLIDPETASHQITLEPKEERRIDWKVQALTAGEATIRMIARATDDSDAVEMSYPVLINGALTTESWSQIIRSDQNSSAIAFRIPEDRDPQQTKLQVRYSPSLAAAVVDALPYMAEFPYGCTEQTLNKFLPLVIAQRMLKDMGIDLKDIRDKTANFNAQELGDAKERAEQWSDQHRWHAYQKNPVFSQNKLDRMTKKGIQRLRSMQNSDGGWGWFSGSQERSYPHTTAWVVRGLQQAKQNGAPINQGEIDRGLQWLKAYQAEELRQLELDDEHDHHKDQADALDALIASILGGDSLPKMLDHLYKDRATLPMYAKSLAGLAFHQANRRDETEMILLNIEQFLQHDDENQTAWLDLGNR
ncbi:MAG: alpha-2-macroglobulin family protein, partial [Verrucomicrobiota bacterium]